MHAVLAKEGVRVPLSSLWGPGGTVLLDGVSLGEAYAVRVTSLRELIGALSDQITMLEDRIAPQLAGHVGYQAVQAIPGVGPVLAAVFVAEIGDIHRFPTARHLCSWAGLTPKHHESDTTVRRGPITKMACGAARLTRRLCVPSGGDRDNLWRHRHPPSPAHV